MKIKAVVKRVLDQTLGRLVKYLFNQVPREVAERNRTVLDVLWARAVEDSADYVIANLPYALICRSREALWDFALDKVTIEGIYAEFGVFEGQSINYLAGKIGPNKTIHGFDSFEGLHEDWRGHELGKGFFSLHGRLPPVGENVQLIKGWFQDTLPEFLAKNKGPFAFCHIDCDTYEANRVLFELMGSRIISGTIIVFDEYFGYTGWRVGEWKAWQEFVSARSIQYEYLAVSAQQVALRIK